MEMTAYSVEGTDRFVHRLGGFYRTGVFSDFTIQTLDQALKVHRLILCTRSEAFCRFFSDACLESENNRECVLEIADEHPRVVEAMIRSFYGLQYDLVNQTMNQLCPMLFNAKVYAIANLYEVEYLKVQAKLTFASLVQDHWASEDFLTAVSEAYTTTPKFDRGLRDVVVAVCQKNLEALRATKAFEGLLEKTPGLATDLVLLSHRWLPESASSKARIMQTYTCLTCFAKWQINVGMAEYFTECPFCHGDKVHGT